MGMLASWFTKLKIRRPHIIGHFDGVANHRAFGWACLPSRIDQKLQVQILSDGRVIAEGVAGGYRADLERAGLAKGYCAFDIVLPGKLDPSAKYTAQVQPFGVTLDPGPIAGVHSESRKADNAPAPLGSMAQKSPIIIGSPCASSGASSGAPKDERSPPTFETLLKPNIYELTIEKIDQTGEIRGWAVDTGDRSALFEIDILVDGVLIQSTRNDINRIDLQKAQKSSGLGGFSSRVLLNHLESGRHSVSIRMPNGEGITQDVLVSSKFRGHEAGEFSPRTDQVCVIIPIFNAAADLVQCIDRVFRYTPTDTDILLIDDASTDPRINDILQRSSSRPNLRILRNENNIGYTATVNRGIVAAGRKHVVLLNSDARVGPHWLDGLCVAAGMSPKVATVTPMSDRAGAFSAPETGNDNSLPLGVDEVSYCRAFRRRGIAAYPAVPTGNGFCMLIRRRCLDEIGLFDVDAFPRGYGEENDFCMRAGRAGWQHIIDDRTYVFHSRSKSFGDAKHALLTAGRSVVDSRYPEYIKSIAIFTTSPQLGLARFRARQAIIDCNEARNTSPRILFVISTRSGGTPHTNNDLMDALCDDVDCWVLRCDAKELELSHYFNRSSRVIRRHSLDERVDSISHSSREYDRVVAQWLREFDIELVHIRHLAWHGLSLPEIARKAGLPVVFSLHDYYTLCPTVQLIDDAGHFCRGHCSASGGICRPQLWPPESMPSLKNNWSEIWRKRFLKLLARCDALVTTSESAKSLFVEHESSLDSDRFVVIPHGRNFDEFDGVRGSPEHGRPLRILVPGNIGTAKGLEIIHRLIEIDTLGLLEFHILGAVEAVGQEKHARLHLHGPYERDAFARKAAAIRPHMGAVFSIWDETYCHTLTEMWSIGVPVMVFEFPNLAGRVRETGAGWVVSHSNVKNLYDEIVRIGFDPNEECRTNAAVANWRRGLGKAITTRRMAADYWDVYRIATRHRYGTNPPGGEEAIAKPWIQRGRLTPRIGVVAPAERDLRRGNASTEIRIWQRTRNQLERGVTYIRMLPETLAANLRAGLVDGAILQRDAVPATMVSELLSAFQAAKVPYLLDLDDHLLSVPPDKDPAGRYAAYVPFLRSLIESADILTVSTEPLRDALLTLNKNTCVVQNRLSAALWRGQLPERVHDDFVRAVYIGTPTHGRDLALVSPALAAVHAADPKFRLAIIGITEGELPTWADRIVIPGEARSYAHFVPWLRAHSAFFDFAIAPLENNEFNRYKSPLKILDAGALGLPVIASNSPVFSNFAHVRGVQLVPDSPDAWTKALHQRIDRKRDDGAALRRFVFENYVLEPSLPDYDRMVLTMLEHKN